MISNNAIESGNEFSRIFIFTLIAKIQIAYVKSISAFKLLFRIYKTLLKSIIMLYQ
jgi:hypothetical protein